jgi:hypothetical protein
VAVLRIQYFSFSLRRERRDEVLQEDEAEATSSPWLYGKEV